MKLNSGRYGMLPYEKCLRYGPESLSDTELMAIILRSGTTGSNCIEIAQKLIDSFEGNGILGLKHMSIARLKSIEGIGNVKAVMLKCIGELSSRISRADRQHMKTFTDSGTVAGYYMEFLADRGLSVPEDVSVVSFDDAELQQEQKVKLLSAVHPKYQLGRITAKNLLRMMEDENWQERNYSYRFPVKLNDGNSVRAIDRR